MKDIRFKVILLFLMISCHVTDGLSSSNGWWPEQRMPSKIIKVRCSTLKERNLTESLSGLAARAVNEELGDELIWIHVTGKGYLAWLDSLFTRNPEVKDLGYMNVWSVVDRMKSQDLIDGYILYKEGDYSVNAATVYAALHDAVLIEESMEDEAVAHGLFCLKDARPYTTGSSFRSEWLSLKDRLNNRMIVTIAPDDYKQRDMAIAHSCMVYWGTDAFYTEILSWIQAPAPIVGWNEGDEGAHVELATKYGHFTTGATICNMPVLSAGASVRPVAVHKNMDPRHIDWADDSHFHSFVLSDGDNMMIQATSVPMLDEYWCNPAIGEIPMSWTSCPVNLSQMCPDAWSYYVQKANHVPGSLIEYGGGYQYPDRFASLQGDKQESVCRTFIAEVGERMKRSGVKVLGFITRGNTDSDEALEAYRMYAEMIDDLVGIVVVQYVPYNGGDGAVYWVENREGIHIPVVTAKYQLWANLDRKGSGNPQEIAALINEGALSEERTIAWTVVHAWSYFKQNPDGSVSDASSGDVGALRGVTPVMWTKERLSPNIKIVSIEELLWRIRMKNYPEETEKVIEDYDGSLSFESPDADGNGVTVLPAGLYINGEGGKQVSVMTLSGMSVYDRSINSSYCDLSGLDTGIYVVRVSMEKGVRTFKYVRH